MDTKMDFEEMLKAVCDEYCAKLYEEFLNTDTTGFEITPEIQERFENMLKNSNGCNTTLE